MADQLLIKCLPSMRQPPEVDFLVLAQPPQSVSLYASIVLAVCQGYVYTSRRCPSKKRPKRFAAASESSVGAAIQRQISFALNWISGRSEAK